MSVVADRRTVRHMRRTALREKGLSEPAIREHELRTTEVRYLTDDELSEANRKGYLHPMLYRAECERRLRERLRVGEGAA